MSARLELWPDGQSLCRVVLGEDHIVFTGPGAQRLAQEYAASAQKYAALEHDGCHVCTHAEWDRLAEQTALLERQIVSQQANLATAGEQMLDAGCLLSLVPGPLPLVPDQGPGIEDILDRLKALDGRINQLAARLDILAQPQVFPRTTPEVIGQ